LALRKILGPKWEEVTVDCRMRNVMVCFEHTLLVLRCVTPVVYVERKVTIVHRMYQS